MNYLIHQPKEHGIYVAVDMNTYRKFTTGDGVACANELWDNHKGYHTRRSERSLLSKESSSNAIGVCGYGRERVAQPHPSKILAL